MASTIDLLKRLSDHQVEFIIVGGMAAALYGSSLVTEDLDVCIPFSRDNVERLLQALAGLHPRQRMVPGRPELSGDPATYAGWRNLYVITDWGMLDFLSEVTGVGNFDALAGHAQQVDVGGVTCRVMGLDDLIRGKRALGRPKDLRTADELEAIRARLRR